MVATRRGANKAPKAEPAPANTLNAPPKRGKKKAAVEEAAPVAEPAPVASKPTRTAAAKRKATTVPDDAPDAKKTTASVRATRAAKVETKAEPAPAAPKRATRGKKAAEPVVEEQPTIAAEPAKPAATRTRKAAAKKPVEPVVEEPVTVEELAQEEAKPASRARKAPAKKAPAPKATTRARKAVEPAPTETVPAITSRPTRGRNVIAAPQESPLKAPARKPTKKAATAAAIPSSAPQLALPEEPFAEFPGYPTTPGHIQAPMTSRQAIAELPQYPKTPSHIQAPISSKDALAALPDYPKTPAHITGPISTKAAMAEMPGYPKTPAHIKAPLAAKDAMNELPSYPKTPAHIKPPISTRDALAEMPGYPKTPAHIQPVSESRPADGASTESIVRPGDMDIINELPGWPTTPAHIAAPISNKSALNELAGYPKTPAHITAPMTNKAALSELPDYPKTPAHVATLSSPKALDEASGDLNTPEPAAVATPSTMGLSKLPSDCVGTPAPVSTPALADKTPERPSTPTNLVWGVTNQEAFAELPEYPKTPVHISAPVSNKEALAEMPSYPNTPALALEAALQEEITASVKKQTPSPTRLANLDVSTVSVELSDIEMVDVDTGLPSLGAMSTLQFAPIQLNAPAPPAEPASPKKSALRSPQKMDPKTPKKAVTWDDKDESDLFLYDGPIQGTTFFVDIVSQGDTKNYIFTTLLKDLGAKIAEDMTDPNITHVLFKDGSLSTLEKVSASMGKIKCVNVGWALDCEENRKRMDEEPYLVDLSVVVSNSPIWAVKPFTPARTPSKYALPPSSGPRSVPSTPTSSEFDRSFNPVTDDKENSELGLFFQDSFFKQAPRTAPAKRTFLMGRSPMKTPSKTNFLFNTPVKSVAALQPFSTTKKRTLEESSSSMHGLSSAPPKRLRFF